MPCLQHLGEVSSNRELFFQLQCDIIVVVQARPDILRQFLARHPQPLLMVCDPDRLVYRQLGLQRVSWLSFFKPSVIWGYLRLMFRGQRVQRPYDGEDVRQLGGDFLLSEHEHIVTRYTATDPTVRPTITAMLHDLRQLQAKE